MYQKKTSEKILSFAIYHGVVFSKIQKLRRVELYTIVTNLYLVIVSQPAHCHWAAKAGKNSQEKLLMITN